MKVKSSRNGEIEFFRFLFCLIVFVFHVNLDNTSKTVFCQNGQLGVEFFFIISGYFLSREIMESSYSQKESAGFNSFQYVKRRYISIFPFHLVAFAAGLIIRLFNDYSIAKIGDFLDYLFLSIPQFFLFHADGLLRKDDPKIVSVEWFLSALLIALFFLYPLLFRFRESFLFMGAPLLSLFCFGTLYMVNENLLTHFKWMGFASSDVIRAIGNLSLGVFSYAITRMIDEKYQKKNRLIGCAGLLCYTMVIVAVNVSFSTRRWFAVPFVLCMAIAISLSHSSLLRVLSDNKWCRRIGSISMPMYLNTNLIRFILVQTSISEMRYRYHVCIAIILNIVLSSLEVYIVNEIRQHNRVKIRS